MTRRRTLVAAGTVTALVAGLGVTQLLPGAAPVARAEGLVPYSGCSALLDYYRGQLRASATAWGFGFGYGGIAFGAADSAAGGSAVKAAAPVAAGAEAVGNGATGTNLQEQGVDEPDVVKLHDGRLAALAQGRLQIVTAEATPRLVGSLRLTRQSEGGDVAWYGAGGGELLLVGDRALVVLPGYRQTQQPQPGGSGTARTMMIMPGVPTTRLVLVDVSGEQPRLLEEATYDAQYVSARLTDGTVRLVTTTRPQPRFTQALSPAPSAQRAALLRNRQAAEQVQLRDVLPQVVRTSADGTTLQRGNAVSCAQTAHAEQPAGAATLLVTTLRPGNGLGATDSDAVTTDGDLVYASADRLYVATSRWGTTGPVQPMDDSPRSDTSTTTVTDEVTTELHGFDTSAATTTRYVGTGSVPGYVMGRWALSSYDGSLRVATTRQPPWDSRGQTSSMVVKLAERDGSLVETGRVEGLGRNERIQAVRYFGNLAAVVTFRQTDPLYLLDLSGDPKVLGELKVPGFSTYLHPLGDGLLLGLGQEATDQGRVTGMQLSVFDVRDLSRPVQVDRLQLGQGYSPALNESRAFTYDPMRRLVTFAYYSWAENGLSDVGALGVRVGSTGQLTEVGRMQVAGNAPPQRVLVEGDRLYAVSDSGVVAGDPATMTRTGATDFARD